MWCSDLPYAINDSRELSWNGGRYRVTAPYREWEIAGLFQSIGGWKSLEKTAGIDCQD